MFRLQLIKMLSPWRDVIEDFAMNICEAVDTAAKHCLPSVGGEQPLPGGVIPGWNEFVKPYRD